MKKLFDEIEMPLVFTLYDMEQAGVRVHAEELKAYGEALVGRIDELAHAADAALTFAGMEAREDGMELKFRIKFSGRHNQGRVHDFFAALGECDDVISVRTDKGGV